MAAPDSTSATPEPRNTTGLVVGKSIAACIGPVAAYFFSMMVSKVALAHFVFNDPSMHEGFKGYFPIAFFMQNLVLSLTLYVVFYLLFLLVGRDAYRAAFLALILAVALTAAALVAYYGAIEAAGRPLGRPEAEDLSAPIQLGR